MTIGSIAGNAPCRAPEDLCTPEHPHGSYVRCRWVLRLPTAKELMARVRAEAVARRNGTFFDPS